jgi:hypothetical protein
MGLADDIMSKIKEEIEKDPQSIGYAGKTDEEIATLLSSSVFKERVVIDAQPSPLNRILVGFADGPNIVSNVEITEAKAIKI